MKTPDDKFDKKRNFLCEPVIRFPMLTMGALNTLPGDVIALKAPLLVSFLGEEETLLLPGYYGLVSQRDDRLVITSIRVTALGEIEAQGEPFTTPAALLDLEIVEATEFTFVPAASPRVDAAS